MKRAKLLIEPTFDFDLLGLVSPVKDYKMAWLINQILGLNLIRSEEIFIEFLNMPNLEISQYFLSLPHGYIQLLKNKSLNSTQQLAYLVPELRNMDYFLLVQDETGQMDLSHCAGLLAKNSLIQSAVRLDVTKLKSKENLLTY
jgi:hypothetical protein